MGVEGPMTDVWGGVSPSKVRENILEMFHDVSITELYIYRDGNRYPDGCQITMNSQHDPNRQMKVTILGQPFKDLQTLIFATLGFEHGD